MITSLGRRLRGDRTSLLLCWMPRMTTTEVSAAHPSRCSSVGRMRICILSSSCLTRLAGFELSSKLQSAIRPVIMLIMRSADEFAPANAQIFVATLTSSVPSLPADASAPLSQSLKDALAWTDMVRNGWRQP